jgi:hypothetical protein
VLSACAPQGRWTRADYELSNNQLLPDAGVEDLSAKIYLIADNQRHELLGNDVALFRTSFSDRYTKVAIRPPQLDLFGQDLLIEALAMTDGFILHLGDACDISNTGEFGRFAWDMRLAPQGWVMAPGNHDGFFFGNSSRTLPGLIREWNEAAETYQFDGTTINSRAMQKDRFVSYYLAALILQDAVWSGPLARAIGPDAEKQYLQWRNRNPNSATAQVDDSFAQFWTAMEALQDEIYSATKPDGDQQFHTFQLPAEVVPSGQPHLRRIAWHIDKDKVWRSFILQQVDISAAPPEATGDRDSVSILVVDTSQYGVQPSLDHGVVSKVSRTATLGYFDFQVAGEHGNILDSQEAATDDFTQSMLEDGERWIVATHHPYSKLGRETYRRFDRLRDAGGIPVTLSAHTHTGEVIWNKDGKREGDWLEINVGSLLDTPTEYRDFQVHRVGDRIAISTNREQLEDVLRDKGLIADDIADYRPRRGDPDYYLDYTSGLFGTEKQADFKVKRILLAGYLRMLNLFEADHPDQTAVHWPKGPDGNQLRSHGEVIAAVRMMLANVQIDDVAALTRFLYELREFDRTRRFSTTVGEQVRAYRLSQAIWASRAEHRTWDDKTYAMDPNISLLVLPRPATEVPTEKRKIE